MGNSQIIESDDAEYVCLLIHPSKPLIFVGTSTGAVEVWDIQNKEKKAELRYLIVNRFGEQLPVEDPVVSLSASSSFQYVYAFMGNHAYCIDTELLVIIEKVPISEEVISGNIGPSSGEIGVVTRQGYISRWAAQFVVRIGHIILPYNLQRAYLIHDWREERVIIVLEDGKLIVANLEGEPYTVTLSFPESSILVSGIVYDRNTVSSAKIVSSGSIEIMSGDDLSSGLRNDILVEGKTEAENKVRNFVAASDTSEPRREYIQDIRFGRESRDRYDAELEQLSDSYSHSVSSVEGDSKTLHYALLDTNSENIHTKTAAQSLIEKISARNQVDPRYLYFSYKIDVAPDRLIETSRHFEFEAFKRNERIKKLIPLALLSSIIALILVDQYISSGLVGFRYYLFPFTISIVVFFYWRSINSAPKLPGILEYRGIRIFSLVSSMGTLFVEIGFRVLEMIGMPF